MKTWFGLFSVLLCCGAAHADAVTELSPHLGETPALVVVVCRASEGDLSTVARIVDQTPWTVFCQGTASPELDRIRSWAKEEELLGKRVCVVDDDAGSLWLAGDLGDAVWVHRLVDGEEDARGQLRTEAVGIAVAGIEAVESLEG